MASPYAINALELIGLIFLFTSVASRVLVMREPSDMTVRKRSSFLWDCIVENASSRDRVTIQWRKDGRLIDLTTNRHLSILRNGSLSFRRVKLNDEGVYECLANHSKGSLASRQVALNIADLRQFAHQPENLSVVEGEWATMRCELDGTPTPIIRWLKDSLPLNLNASRYVLLDSGRLQIREVSVSDTGWYRCTAHNLARSRNSSSGYLHVVNEVDGGQVVQLFAPIILKAVVNGRLLIECFTLGPTATSLSWSKQGSGPLVMGGRYSQVGQGSLLISPVHLTDDGVYQCMTDFNQSTLMRPTTVIVLERPTVVSLSSNFSLDSVDFPVGRTVRFRCRYTGTPLPTISWLFNSQPLHLWFGNRVQMMDGEIVIHDSLIEDSGYYQCRARNTVGSVSNTVYVQMSHLGIPPDPPRNIQVRDITSTGMTITFRPAHTRDQEVILAYSVHFTPHNSGTELDSVFHGGTSSPITYRLDDLKPYTTYSIHVRSYTRMAVGRSSDPITVTTLQDVPYTVPAMNVTATSASSVLVAWQIMSPSRAHGVVAGHQIHYVPTDSTVDDVRHVDVLPNRNRYMLTGLEPGLAYEVLVITGTEAGYPPFMHFKDNWHFVQLPNVSVSTVPEPPLLNLYTLDGRTVEVLWQMSWEGGRMLQGGLCMERTPPVLHSKLSHIKLTSGGAPDASQTPTTINITEPGSRRYVITKLQKNSWYEIELAVMNDVGESAPVWETVRTTSTPDGDFTDAGVLIRPPPAPTGLWSAVTNETSILVQWLPAHSPFVGNITYRVRLRELPPALNNTHIVISRSEGTMVSDLLPYTTYEISVQSVCEDLEGSYTKSVVHCRTYEGVPTAPRDTSAVIYNSSTVHLTWSPPEHCNGIIRAYVILYSTKSQAPDQEWLTKEEQGHMRTAVIEKLDWNTVYYFKIRAGTSVGLGPPSDLLLLRTDVSSPNEHRFKMGIIIGVAVNVVFIIIGLVLFFSKKRCLLGRVSGPTHHCQCQRAHLTNGFIPNHINGTAVSSDPSHTPMLARPPPQQVSLEVDRVGQRLSESTGKSSRA